MLIRIELDPEAEAELEGAVDWHPSHSRDVAERFADEYERVKDRRGMLRSALGYAHRQRDPLTRFFDDGRLQLTNNNSERELRRIATGRKAWLFVGSDDRSDE